MTKAEAIRMIDEHKNRLLNPVEMLNWTWLRVIILHISDDYWDELVEEVSKILSR